MNIDSVMERPIVAATRKATCREIAIYMLLGGYSGIPINEPDGSVVGMVTEFDLIRALRADQDLENTAADEVMSREVISVSQGASVESAMEMFDTKRILLLPVLRKERMVGMVSRTGLLRAAVEPQFMRFD
jgi:CBS domain-containing protein